jgi:hypothetical protein
MKALTGELITVELPKLPNGADGKAPNPKDALESPPAKAAVKVVHPPAVR